MLPDYDTPKVSVSSFMVVPGETLAPHFKIGLRVVNPNDFALELEGASYSVSLEGFEIITGAASDLPTIAAYGEGEFTIDAQASLWDSIRLFNSMAAEPRTKIDYEFKAKLDTGNFIVPLYLTESGSIDLAAGGT
jgi:LEA14-like dessication related protein